jgi:hypothetical protein
VETFSIRNFRPVEAKEDATDQDRGVLRICEGFAPFPQGALCAGPEWKSLWGLSTLGASIETALGAADVNKAHFVTIAKNGHTALICWSMQLHRPLCFVWVAGGTNTDLDATGSVVITATTGTTWRDKDPAAEWFASAIGTRFFLGNGVANNDNLVGSAGARAVLGPAATPADVNLMARVRIPPCTSFRQHVNRSILAAGNAAAPMRVWITDPPNAGETTVDGVRSLGTSFVDVHPHGGATRITALSVFQQYVTVHTDGAPMNLYGVGTTADGWKCDQGPSAANASAINPNCVGDVHGDADFYLGRDLEVYLDQAIRGGPFEKKVARAQEIATVQGAGVWNRQAKTPLQTYGYHVAYDRNSRLFWMFVPNSLDARPALFVYNERTKSVAGPWRYPAAAVGAVVRSLGASYLAVITTTGEALYAKLDAIGELAPELVEAPATALGAAYEVAIATPTPTPGLPYVAMPADNSAVLEVVGANVVGLASMLGAVTTLTAGSYTLTKFYNNAYLSRWESPWQDLGNPKVLKVFHGIQLTIERDARAYVGIYAESDGGKNGSLRGGKWFGLVHGRRTVRVPLNLAGLKIRVRVVAVCFNSGRFLTRDATIEYSVGGTD